MYLFAREQIYRADQRDNLHLSRVGLIPFGDCTPGIPQILALEKVNISKTVSRNVTVACQLQLKISSTAGQLSKMYNMGRLPPMLGSPL